MADIDNKPPLFKKGEKVTIVKGNYKSNKYGTFLRYSGTVSADVKVENDTAAERCLRLTSIARVEKEREETISVDKEGFYEVISELEAMPITSSKQEKALQSLIDKLESLVVEEDNDIRLHGSWKNTAFKDYYEK